MGSNHPAGDRRRVATSACDSCRMKRIKCEYNTDEQGSIRWAKPVHGSTCRACQSRGLLCTFDSPVKKRGPIKRKTHNIAPTHRESSQGFESPLDSLEPALLPSPGAHSLLSWPLSSPASRVSRHTPQHSLPSDKIIPRTAYDGLISTYLEHVYPTVPLVHRPTFIRNIQENRGRYDDTFLSQTVSICAIIVVLMPRKFEELQQSSHPLPFETRSQMVEACCEFVVKRRPANYFDEVNITKWSIAYMLQLAHFQLGSMNRGTFWYAEDAQMTYVLGLGDVKMYQGLNCIEKQLRKKAHWLTIFMFFHQHLGDRDAKLLPLYSNDSFNTIIFEDLWPIEVDDEYISEEAVLQQPPDKLCVTSGFNANARLFWTGCTQRKKAFGSEERVLSTDHTSTGGSEAKLKSLLSTIEELKTVGQDSEKQLMEWISQDKQEVGLGEAQSSQVNSLLANIQVTRLWLQSLLFERVIWIEQQDRSVQHQVITNERWEQREDICKQLLTVLHNVRQDGLEPNGNSLTLKIRDVAATLLELPADDRGVISWQIKSYLRSFVDILVRVDVTENNRQFYLDSQAWTDLSLLSKKTHTSWEANKSII